MSYDVGCWVDRAPADQAAVGDEDRGRLSDLLGEHGAVGVDLGAARLL